MQCGFSVGSLFIHQKPKNGCSNWLPCKFSLTSNLLLVSISKFGSSSIYPDPQSPLFWKFGPILFLVVWGSWLGVKLCPNSESQQGRRRSRSCLFSHFHSLIWNNTRVNNLIFYNLCSETDGTHVVHPIKIRGNHWLRSFHWPNLILEISQRSVYRNRYLNVIDCP